jgi:hypothetical protein
VPRSFAELAEAEKPPALVEVRGTAQLVNDGDTTIDEVLVFLIRPASHAPHASQCA